MDTFFKAWGQKGVTFGLASSEGEPLTQLLLHYQEQGRKVPVALFLHLFKAMMIVRTKARPSFNMFDSEQRVDFTFSLVNNNRTKVKKSSGSQHQVLPPQIAGFLGRLRDHPAIPEPLPDGTYGGRYVQHSNQRGAMTSFFLEAVRADQKDVVRSLLSRHLIDDHLKSGCCISDPLYAAVCSGRDQMADLLLTHGSVNPKRESYSSVNNPVTSGNNAGDEGSMACGADRYALTEAAEQNDIKCLAVLLKHMVIIQKKNLRPSINSGHMKSVKNKALSAAVTSGNEICVRMMLESGCFDVNATYSPCSCGSSHSRTPKGTTALHCAVGSPKKERYQGIMELLTLHGANWEAKDEHGDTPASLRDAVQNVTETDEEELDEAEVAAAEAEEAEFLRLLNELEASQGGGGAND